MTCAYEDPNCEIGLIVGMSEACFKFWWGASWYWYNRSCFQPCQIFLFILIILLYILTDLTFTFLKSEAFQEAVICFPVLSINSPGKWDSHPPICDFRRQIRVDLDKDHVQLCWGEAVWLAFSSNQSISLFPCPSYPILFLTFYFPSFPIPAIPSLDHTAFHLFF